MVRHVLVVASTLMLLVWAASVVSAQSAMPASGTTYRVFLTSGEPLPSYGEPVLVGDRVIFNLLVGSSDAADDVQLVSLPVAEIDSDRTLRYAQAMRASHYGATRGEADYAALTAEVARVLDQLTAITDARRRLRLAEDARRELLLWSEQHYQYRADDIRELALLFDDVIVELRIAAGEPSVSFQLVARPAPLEPLLPTPTVRESVALALTAARVADVGTERVEILKKAAAATDRVGDAVVQQTVAEALAGEVKAGTAYASLISAMRARSDEALRRGDVASVERIARELERQDRQLGQRRPAEVREFNAHLAATLEATRTFRAAVDAHARQLSGLQRYDQGIRPLLDRFDDMAPLLTALREMRGLSQAQVSAGEADILRLGRDLDRVRPPLAQASVHAAFQNVLRIAREAFVRRRQARASQSAEMREASAAAAGALLLVQQVRVDLAASLRRPTIQ